MLANFETLLTEYPSGMWTNSGLAARFTNLSSDTVLPGNGAAELIQAYIRLKNVKTGIIYPTFEEYPNRLSKENRIVFTPQNPDFSYSAKDIISFFDKQNIQQILIINPDNPSGNTLSYSEIQELMNWTQNKGIRFILDESFVDFARGKDRFSLFDKELIETFTHLIVIKSISKSYGVPGLRLGLLASGDKELIKKLKQEVSIWNINSFAEFFMQIFVKYQSQYEQACELFEAERERFYENLRKVPYLRVIPSSANYFLCEVTGKYTAIKLCSELLHHHNLLIKNCINKAGFDKKEYIRIAIRNEEDNDKLVNALLTLNKENDPL